MISSEATFVVGHDNPTRAASFSLTVFGCSVDEARLFRSLAADFDVAPVIVDAPLCVTNAELARGTTCVSVGHKTPVDADALLALRRAGVTYLSTRSVGFDHVDLGAAERLGIAVETVSYAPGGVADFTLMLLLMAVRNMRAIVDRATQHDFRLPAVPGRDLSELTVGVIGTGRIGAAVIDRLRGFGCHIVAHDQERTVAVDYVELDDLLARSDIVTLHTPLNAGTHHLLDRERIGRMKPRAVVINTARGALVDTEALVAALERGSLGGAALDVLEGEDGIFYADCRDRPIDNELLLRLQVMPNVVLTPHVAYDTSRALVDIVENTMRNSLRHARKEAACSA